MIFALHASLGYDVSEMEWLKEFDVALYLYINQLPHFRLFNRLMLLVSESVFYIWVLFFLYLFILVLVHKKNAGRGFIFLVLATLSGFILNNYGLKDFFGRSRPFVILPNVVLLEPSLSDYSFPSGHAFSAALLAALFIRRRRIFYPLSFYALLAGLSRIYIGAHFPSDVLVGLSFGFVYGLSVNHFYERFLEKEEFHILKSHLET